jgi:hypothetical protein
MIVIRCYYQTGASSVCMTVRAARSAPGAGTPGLNFRGALTALRNRFLPRIEFCQEPKRGLFDRFQFSPFARVFHEGNISDGVSQGVVRE